MKHLLTLLLLSYSMTIGRGQTTTGYRYAPGIINPFDNKPDTLRLACYIYPDTPRFKMNYMVFLNDTLFIDGIFPSPKIVKINGKVWRLMLDTANWDEWTDISNWLSPSATLPRWKTEIDTGKPDAANITVSGARAEYIRAHENNPTIAKLEAQVKELTAENERLKSQISGGNERA